MASLIWQPLHRALEARLKTGDRLNWIVAPFVKIDALKRLLETKDPSPGFKLICRWRPEDLVGGVSDLEVFTYLHSRGYELYVNSQLHMKLYAFESNVALCTSANLTLRGLGYVDLNVANIETGSEVDLSAQDWVNLYSVARESRLVTADIYDRFKQYVDGVPPPVSAPEAPDILGQKKRFTIASLPATDSPTLLADFYCSAGAPSQKYEDTLRAYQDLATFEIPFGLTRMEFLDALGKSFLRNEFVREFVDHLQIKKDLRFGAVNAWIHERCEDVPLPYRWELKRNTHAFYNWLAHFIPQISWDRPNYSQVIYWNG